MNNFCENRSCIFHNIQTEKDEVVLINKDKQEVKRYLSKISDNDGFETNIWLCEYCTGVLELVSDLISFNRIKGGVVN